ncbi:MAG: FlgD immunoglobulin-like domain containing protein [Candidatus Poribacteria bacterium]
MYISGDIVDDTNTFEWIPYPPGGLDEIVLNLTDGTGEKVVSAKLKDKAGNESEEIKATIIFSATSPKISRVDSWDESDTSDNDEYYRAGQKIKIAIWSDKDTAWFLGSFRIKSSVNNYNSGNLKAIDEGDGRYTYLWNTTDLADGEYAVEAVLSDGVSSKAFNRSMVITIDNTPPDIPSVEIDVPKVQISGEKIRTASTSVGLSLSGESDVKEVYLDGDIVDDANSFEWIPYPPLPLQGGDTEKLTINLTPEDGEKQVLIKVRDAALNESESAVKTIVLDTTGPSGDILINEGAEYTTDSLVSIEIETIDAAEMYLSGDIIPSLSPPLQKGEKGDFQWIPYATSTTVRLTEDDGAKTVKVSFKDDLGNIGEEFEDTITLDTSPPKIKAVTSQNIANPEDDDGRYRIGETIKITPEVEGEEPDLKGSLRITSEIAGYDSGSQRLIAEGEDSILSFLWETNRFRAAEDYKVEIRLQDAAGNETTDSSLILALVSASVQESVTINNGDEYTELASVELKIFSDNAAEMLIEGDVKDDSDTFEWIDYASSLKVKLTLGDGEKTVKVTFRDTLQRESGPVEDAIILDTEAPKILEVKSHDAADEMDNDGKYHAGETVKFIVETAAAETGLKGAIRIHSSKVSYDSGVQKLQDESTGEYSYLWETEGLKESDDYVVEAALTDLASHQTIDDALAIVIDNTPPRSLEFGIRDSELTAETELTETKTRSLTLTISAEDSVQMWIEGDVVDDTNTFEWIPYNTELVVNLTPGDGEKTIKVRHKDIADNESLTAEATILLNESPPGIQSVDSEDKDNPADNDEIYHAGQPIVILIEAADAETGLEAMVQIKSEANAYDSGIQRADEIVDAVPSDAGEGSYSYLWDTSGLKDASDYLVKVILQDSLGQIAVDESLTITIDNDPPSNYELRITNYEDGITNSGSIILEISAEDALEMFIEGDIVEDDTTFKWIPFLENKEVELTEGDGEKIVRVKFRDEALNESPAAETSITLDTTPPANAQMVINEGEKETDSRAVVLHLLAEEATEIYIDGDVTESDNTFKWLPYKSLKEVELTEGDGVKLVGVKYRDDVGNESERIEASIILDQPGPTSPSIIIDNGEAYTSAPKINLKLSADGATEMYIDGDVVVDSVTFQWIPYQTELQVNLINNDGEKVARARFRNGAGNESEQVEASVILDQTPPVIEAVESYDANNTSDNNGIYHPGQIVLIKAMANESETGLDGSIRIRSSAVKYDSGAQKLNDGGDGSYTYLWRTVGLRDAEDYIVEITLKDAVEFSAVDNSLVIAIDANAPVEPKVLVSSGKETFLTRSVDLNLEAEDAVEMFIAGDVVDDTNTFQWIPFAPEIVVNLAGGDGEKNIKVKFRDAAMNETENAEIQVTLELSKPRLLPGANLIQPDGLETAYLVLSFDEPIGNVSKKDFYVDLQNPNKLEEHLELNTSEVEPMVDENRVVIQFTEEQMDILKSWNVKDGDGKIPDEIWVQIPENSVFDLVGNGNLSDNGKPSIAHFTRPAFLQQAVLATLEFSPNGDGVKDEATILYALNRDSEVTVKVEDWRKHLIRQWERTLQLMGITHELKWDGKKEDGSDCPDGVYTIIVESVEPLTGASVIAKTFNVILDTTPPQIIDKKPLPGGRIASETEIAIEVVDKSENQAASGIDEQNVYLIFDNNPEQTFPLTKTPDAEGMSPLSEAKGKYTLFPGQFILESRKHIVTFHVADKAGNYTEEIAEYTVATTGASPLLQLMNYPNPFKPGGSTTIRYVLNDAVKSAVMCIYDAGGNLVLLKEMQAGDELLQPGEHRIFWDGTDLFGELLARGVYFCEFRVVTKDKGDTTKKLHKIAVW